MGGDGDYMMLSSARSRPCHGQSHHQRNGNGALVIVDFPAAHHHRTHQRIPVQRIPAPTRHDYSTSHEASIIATNEWMQRRLVSSPQPGARLASRRP